MLICRLLVLLRIFVSKHVLVLCCCLFQRRLLLLLGHELRVLVVGIAFLDLLVDHLVHYVGELLLVGLELRKGRSWVLFDGLEGIEELIVLEERAVHLEM